MSVFEQQNHFPGWISTHFVNQPICTAATKQTMAPRRNRSRCGTCPVKSCYILNILEQVTHIFIFFSISSKYIYRHIHTHIYKHTCIYKMTKIVFLMLLSVVPFIYYAVIRSSSICIAYIFAFCTLECFSRPFPLQN